MPNTTTLFNTNFPDGSDEGRDAIIQIGGLGIGFYAPGSNAYVHIKVSTPRIELIECGDNHFPIYGSIYAPGEALTSDVAYVDITKKC